MDQLNNSVIRRAGGDVNMRGGGSARGGARAWHLTSRSAPLSRSTPGGECGRGDPSPFQPESTRQVAKIFDRQYHSPSKVLKLEDDPWGSCAMYSPDKMKSGGGLMGPPGCFPARYSPTYRSTDPRRCVPNPSVSRALYS